MNKVKRLLEEAILFPLAAISNEIKTTTMNNDDLSTKALAIKTLAESYDIVHRGKKVNH